MKIRTGFVSNSSSASFCIPSICLTDEQKELLISLDSFAETIKKYNDANPGLEIFPVYDHPKNEAYHKIFQDMVDNKEWGDEWAVSERRYEKDYPWIGGSTWMDNGDLLILMERIGIDLTSMEWDHDYGTTKATNPIAIQFFIDRHRAWYDNLSEEEKKGKGAVCEAYGLDEPSELSIYEKDDDEDED